MTCANCHKTIEDDSRYCVWCGHQVGAPLPARRPIREAHALLGGIISFVITIGIIVGTLAWAAAGWSKSSYYDKTGQRLVIGLLVLLVAAVLPYALLRTGGQRSWARGHLIGIVVAVLGSILAVFLFLSSMR